MNLNELLALPGNRARSLKLHDRKQQELREETLSLAQESKEMEETLQGLKESLSREEEETGGRSAGGSRWKSGQAAALTNNSSKKIKENTNSSRSIKESTLQKLSVGKLKLRVLNDAPPTAPRPAAPPPPPPATVALLTNHKRPRLRGRVCGQCEVKTAGVMCAECTEDYCIPCFARFHHKGALKLHKMFPIQPDKLSHHHGSPLDVVSRFQKHMKKPGSNNPSDLTRPPNPTRTSFTSKPVLNLSSNCKATPLHAERAECQTAVRGEGWLTEMEAGAWPTFLTHPHTEHRQNHGRERGIEVMEEEEEEEEGGSAASLLEGEYDDEESARSFQEALREWRGGKRVERTWRSAEARAVSVSATGTQADLPPDGGRGEGGGGGGGRVPVRVEFKENTLTYMDRLLLKKHRRKLGDGVGI